MMKLLSAHQPSILITVIFIMLSINLWAEGTKQLEPKPTDPNSFCKVMLSKSIYNHRIPFALMNCPSDYRLNIRINDFSNEKIYIGFGTAINYYDTVQVIGDVYYQLKDPAGNVVPGHSLQLVPVSGQPGFIQTRGQANAGPDINNSNPSGYLPIEIDPSMNGDYFIEFRLDCEEFQFKYFDITVTNESTVVPGRLWSKSWQLSSGILTSDNHSDALFYIYTNDSIVTKFDCNSLKGGVWTIYSNEWGCSTTGEWRDRRKSSLGNASLRPEHMLFLNEPDLVLFPSGTIGQMISAELINLCDTVLYFGVTVNKRGTIILLLDLPPINEPIAGPEDIEQTFQVNSGYNILDPPWNGNNAFGEPILNNTEIVATLIFINGLTNLPLFDVEENPKGFKVDIVRPDPGTGSTKLNLFWDDSRLPYGSGVPVNVIDGCLYTGVEPFSGCHNWVYEDVSMGDGNTVNTWWFLPGTDSIKIPIILQFQPRLGMISGPGGICKDQLASFKTTPILNAQQYVWEINGNGFSYNIVKNAPDTIFSFLFDQGMAEGYYTVSVRGRNSECGDGEPVQFLLYLFGETSPPIHSSGAICSTSILEFTVPGSYYNFNWSVGQGNINGSNQVNPVQISWGSPGIDTIMVSFTSADCGDRLSILPVQILPLPDADFHTSDFSIACSGLPVTFTDETTVSQGLVTLKTWTWGDGGSDTTHQLTIDHSFGVIGDFQVTLRAMTSYGCAAETTKPVTIIPYPQADFSYFRSCIQQPVILTDLSTGRDIDKWSWDFDSTPAITGNTNTQKPSATFNSFGTFPVTLVVENKYRCRDTVTKAITIYDVPKAMYDYETPCEGSGNSFFSNSLEADTSITEYNWKVLDNNILLNIYLNDPANIYLPEAKEYQVRLNIMDAYGCVDSVTKTINTIPKPSGSFTFTDYYNTTYGWLLFENTTSGALSYQWFFGDSDSSSLTNPDVKFNLEANYPLTLISYSQEGCPDTLVKWYYYLPGLSMPNAFTPDNDGLNDTFRPVTERTTLDPYLLMIFDRWGKNVYTSNVPEQGWDGTMNGKPCVQGTYAYILKFRKSNLEVNEIVIRQGSVLLIR
jgi:gliding motility-associated-like protein